MEPGSHSDRAAAR